MKRFFERPSYSLLLAALLLAGCQKPPVDSRTADLYSAKPQAAVPATPAVPFPPAAAEVHVEDGVITTQVRAALSGDSTVNGLDIGVITRQGTVQLSGIADKSSQIFHAMDLAQRVTGVKGVNNQMSIKK